MFPSIDSTGHSSASTVYLVTGATGAIGKAIARQLAAKPNAEVVLVCRNQTKAEQAVTEITTATRNPKVRFELADLSRHKDIQNLAKRWTGPLHVLINNAACTPRARQETPEGIEMQFATNVLGYFRLIEAFTEVLKASAPSRIVNVASYWAGGLSLDDLEFTRRRYDNDSAYRQSKQANRMLTVAFSDKLQAYGISANACHPGDVNSKLSNDLGFGGHESPDQGAATPVWLATHSIGIETTGRYFEHKHEVDCGYNQNKQAINALYQACAAYNER